MLDDLVDQEFPTLVVNHLMNLDADASVFFRREGLRLNPRIQLSELTGPVFPDRGFPQHPAAFHSVGPIDIRTHRGQNRLDFPPVERRVDPAKKVDPGHSSNMDIFEKR